MRGRKISKFRFSGSIFNAKKHDKKIFRNSNFSDFLGIKSEIHQCTIETIHGYLRQISGHIIGQISSQISLLRLSRGSIRIKFFLCNC